MDTRNSKEVIYKIHNIKSYFNNVVKIYPKRKSDDIIDKKNMLLLMKQTNSNSNADTAGESNLINPVSKKSSPKSSMNIPKPKKKICIHFKDLVVESEKSDDDNTEHMELALQIKRKRIYTNNPKQMITHCNKINLDKIENKSTVNKSKSLSKVILGEQNEENIIIKTIRKKLFCC